MIVRILVACEESQAVTIELRRLGHEAHSCDLQDCSGGHPEWHIKDDALALVNGRCRFQTMDREWHEIVGKWDMIIAHPPCTYLTAAGAVRLYNRDHTVKDEARFRKGIEAAAFFRAIMEADCPRIVIENPVPMKVWELPDYDQIIEPFQFGDPWRKRTCLWLKNTPPLRPTEVVKPLGLWVGSTTGKRDATIYSRYALQSKRDPRLRSKTFPGIARAMAEQWAGKCEEE